MVRLLAPLAAAALVLLPVLLLSPPAQAQDRTSVRTSLLGPEDPPASLDRGPLDRLGWGTAEDLHLDLGGGLAIAPFSGNVLLRLHPFVRGDLPPDAQASLNYNSLDPLGSPELALGWSWDLGRRLVDGAWGDRILIDGDGFRDSFFAGPKPTVSELGRVRDEVALSWRRSTSLRERRQAGGERAFRAALGADPLFLAEMRVQTLGPKAREPGTTLFVSEQRGYREMTLQGEGRQWVVARGDGGQEFYGQDGRLERIEPGQGSPIHRVMNGGVLSRIDVGNSPALLVDVDASNRVQALKTPAGRRADFDYVDRYLHRAKLPAGEHRFVYDGAGRLIAIDGPAGPLRMAYDPASGRVVSASGPKGTVRLSDVREVGGALEVEVSGLVGGQTITCRWDPKDRRREVDGPGGLATVHWETERPLPIRWEGAGLSVEADWDELGRLLRLRSRGQEVEWRRSETGLPQEIRDLSGETVRLDWLGEGRLAGWWDAEGRPTSVETDNLGLVRLLRRPGGGEERVQHSTAGLLRSVEYPSQGRLQFRYDSEGLLRSLEGGGGGPVQLRRSVDGSVSQVEWSSGRVFRLEKDGTGALSAVANGRFRLEQDDVGRLESWTGPFGRRRVRRGEGGLVRGLDGPEGNLWTVERDGLGRPTELYLGDGTKRPLVWSAGSELEAWGLAAGAPLALERDRLGRVVAWSTPQVGTVRRRLDAAGRALSLDWEGRRWKLQRDATGRVTLLVDPLEQRTQLGLDAGGFVAEIRAPEGLSWRLGRDQAGRLKTLSVGGRSWSLRRSPTGRPESWTLADSSEPARLEWDRAGRLHGLLLGEKRAVQVEYGESGPSRIGRWRRGYDVDAALEFWSDTKSEMRWSLRRSASGRVGRVSFQGSGDEAVPDWEREIVQSRTGRLTRTGAVRLRWLGASVVEVDQAGPGGERDLHVLQSDPRGLFRQWTRGDLALVQVARETTGEARAVVFPGRDAEGEDLRVLLRRDGAGRIDAVEWGLAGAHLELRRDGLGRISGWERLSPTPLRLQVQSLDGTGGGAAPILADALGIESDEELSSVGLEPGSRRLELRGADGHRLWSTVLPVEEEDEDPIGRWTDPATRAANPDPIGALLAGESGSDVSKAAGDGAGDALSPDDVGGARWLPSPFGAGAALGFDGGLALLDDAGRPLARIDSLGGLEDADEEESRQEPHPSSLPLGSVRGVWRWWSGLAPHRGERAHLPAGLASSPVAWTRPRTEVRLWSAHLPGGGALAGPGDLLPPLPGAERLVPAPAGQSRASVLDALIVSGDLHPRIAEHRNWLALPPETAALSLPALGALRALARRRTWPSAPPGWRPESIVGLSPQGLGLITYDGLAHTEGGPWELDVAVGGLPAGSQDATVGGPPGFGPGGSGADPPLVWPALPSDARETALDHYASGPLEADPQRRFLADSDATLLAARALLPRSPESLSGWLPLDRSRIIWRIEGPDGQVVHVDDRGRLLSVDEQGQLLAAWSGSVAAKVGRALLLGRLRGPIGPAVDSLVRQLAVPGWLPSATGPLESRWGLLPADPRLELDSEGALRFRSAP